MVHASRLPALCLSLLLIALPVVSGDAPTAEVQVRSAALEFGRALLEADMSRLRSVLPERGKVRLQLARLGPEEGVYSAGQVELVLKDFLRQGRLRSFDLLRLDWGGEGYALVCVRARLADRNGKTGDVELHLNLQPEDHRWVLREIRETPP